MRHGIYGILLIIIGIASSKILDGDATFAVAAFLLGGLEILWDLFTTNYDRKNSTSYNRKE